VAKLSAVADEELQGGLAVGAVLGDIGLDLAGARAANGLCIGRVGLFAANRQLRTPQAAHSFPPSIPSPHLPDDLENAGRGLGVSSGHDVSQSHGGNGEDGLVEQHGERLKTVGSVKDWIKIAQRV
jgi:hypothetical protein